MDAETVGEGCGQGSCDAYTEAEYRFGKRSLQRSPEVLRDFWEKSLQVQEQIEASLPEGEEARIANRRREVEDEISLLRKMLEECI